MDLKVKKSIKKLKKCRQIKVDGMRFSEVDVAGDGNCLFRALSQAICGSDKRHYDLRFVAANYMVANKEVFKPQIHSKLLQQKYESLQRSQSQNKQEDNFEAYINIIKELGVHGGQLEILALAKALDKKIYLKMPYVDNFQLINPDGKEIVYLEYLRDDDQPFGHYRLLVSSQSE